jgi:DMSO/TMAO reductase YedYZ heme-binding membrane subunit
MKEEIKPEQESTKDRFSIYLITLVFLFSVTYSIIRYHIFGGVEWSQFPFFIMNKVISLNGIILLIITFSIKPLNNLGVKMPHKWLKSRKSVGIVGFINIFVHLIMSVMLFSPAYYSKFFNTDETLTLNSGLSMLFGVLAFVILWFYNLSFYKSDKDKEINKVIKSRKFLLLVMPFTAMHLFFMGYKGWLNPEGWNGGIPPISLIAFVIFFVGYFINVFGRK